MIPDPQALPALEAFRHALGCSLPAWKEQGFKVVWLKIPTARSDLIPIAVAAGFVFHHCGHHGDHHDGQDYLMLTYQLVEGAFVFPYASHYVGAGGVVLNDRQELLVVWEKAHRQDASHAGQRYYKLPGGALHHGEHLVDGVVREIYEETGVYTRFESLVCFRHWHNYRFAQSDIYFVCRLSPLTEEIRIQEEEIAESLWMPVQEYLTSEHVGIFNKRIVEAALNSHGHLVPAWIEGYQTDPKAREIFMPRT